MYKKLLCFFCTAVIISSVFVALNRNKTVFASARAEIAMELSTETVLTESNADERMPMASTTKILTAIIIIEDCDIDEVIKVPDDAVGEEGSSIYLKKDEEISIVDLLYGLMLRSGNDSAAALAIHHSGSKEKFAEVMNERAIKIGATNSNFKNPSGLPDSEHYTTARDLCKIACYAMRNDKFVEIVSTTSYTGKYRSYAAKNKMLHLYEGANGVKTGYTLAAGRCLVSSAVRDNMDVVCVVLNCPDMYERSCYILDKCFNDFKLVNIEENKVFMCDTVPCKLNNRVQFVVKNTTEIDFKIEPIANSGEAEQNKPIALLEIYCKNELLFTEKLYSILSN